MSDSENTSTSAAVCQNDGCTSDASPLQNYCSVECYHEALEKATEVEFEP